MTRTQTWPCPCGGYARLGLVTKDGEECYGVAHVSPLYADSFIEKYPVKPEDLEQGTELATAQFLLGCFTYALYKHRLTLCQEHWQTTKDIIAELMRNP